MLPDGPGSYVLVLELTRAARISIGLLGTFGFPPGWYTYVGSARRPGGLAARIGRHLRARKGLRWHVDYLRVHAEPIEVWYTEGVQRLECGWAGALAGIRDASVVAPGFGASDCRCRAHLFHFAARPSIAAFGNLAGQRPTCLMLSPAAGA